jgi:hypothetical protein
MDFMKTIIESILDKMPDLTKVRKQFLIHIFALIVSLRGRMNFLNMERQGTYSEKSYRLHSGRALIILRLTNI